MTLAQRFAVAAGAIGILISNPIHAAVALPTTPSISTAVPANSTVAAPFIPTSAEEWTTNDTVDTIGFGLLAALGGGAAIIRGRETRRNVREQHQQSVLEDLRTILGNVQFVVLFSRSEKISTDARDAATSEAVKAVAGLETKVTNQELAELLSDFRSMVYRLLAGGLAQEDESKCLENLRQTAGELRKAVQEDRAAS